MGNGHGQPKRKGKGKAASPGGWLNWRKISIPAIAAVVTFVITLVTAYSALLEQKDDITVITGQNGFINLKFPEDVPSEQRYTADNAKATFKTDIITFTNSGNRSFTALNAYGFYVMGTVDELSSGATACDDYAFNGKEGSLGLPQTQVKPGEMASAPLKFPSDDKIASIFEDASLATISQGAKNRNWLASCIRISYATPDIRADKRFTIMKIQLQGLNFGATWARQGNAMAKEMNSAKQLISRHRTTVAWINKLMDFF
jgi:hypothetical protein